MTIAEHKLSLIHQLDELSEEALIEVEKLIAKLKVKPITTPVLKKRRQPPKSIAGKAKIMGDLIAPCFDSEDFECLK